MKKYLKNKQFKKFFSLLKKLNKKNLKIILFIFLITLIIFTGAFHNLKPAPPGTNYESKEYIIPTTDITFLADLTYYNKKNDYISNQEIFDTLIQNIKSAKDYIILDMFLINDDGASKTQNQRNLSSEIINALIEKKQSQEIEIYLITDPINTAYFGSENKNLQKLQDSGVKVVYTDLDKLKDPNPTYNSVHRVVLRWISPLIPLKIFPHPFRKGDKTTLQTYINLPNFKANHRKVFTTNTSTGPVSIITSGNAHDASSRHSNIGILINGSFSKEILHTESEIAKFSGSNPELFYNFKDYNTKDKPTAKIKLITEKKILKSLITELKNTEKGDTVDIAIFYLSSKEIIDELIDCSNRGVEVRIILDPNKDAFGHEKNGIPNRQVANELIKKSNNKISIRWYNTHGEQFHTKMTIISKKNETIIILGSANLTRRNLENYNLELNVQVKTPNNSSFAIDTKQYFSRIWNNEDENQYTTNYETYEDNSKIKYMLYKFTEFSGMSTY
jgi:phosphatidylserine/phosphatidylglycerophosphate/cardiolipin synthase-like enzyme